MWFYILHRLIVCLTIMMLFIGQTQRSSAQIWDLSRQYSDMNNPNGVWTYGYRTGTSGSVALYPPYLSNYGIWTWYLPDIGGIAHNTLYDGFFSSKLDDVLIHPGHTNDSLVRFTVPFSGFYNIDIMFRPADGTVNGQWGGSRGLVIHNETVLMSQPTASNPRFLSQVNLVAGDTFDIQVNNLDGVAAGDNTPVLARFELVDQTPPTSSFTTTPSATWSNTDVSASITATDNTGGSGVKEIHYSVNMGTEQIVTGSSATFTLTDNGTHSIAYYAVDNAGNTETTQYATVRIDNTRPTVDAYYIGSLVTVIAQDTFSGLASTKVSIDGAAAVDYTGSFIVAPGAHTVTYWATDQAGNESTREVILVGVTFSSLVVSPRISTDGQTRVGTLLLSAPAPVGGITVQLESSSPLVGVALSGQTPSVSTTVFIPQGISRADFFVSPKSVSRDTMAVITARVGETEICDTVYVVLPSPIRISIAPVSIIGGDTAVGTITLSGYTNGGVPVTLKSSHASLVVPSSVMANPGLTVTFPIQTSVVTSDTPISVYAEIDGSRVYTTVIVRRVAPKSITFAPVSVIGGNSSVATLTVTKPAPAGGIVVDLRSVSSNVSVPATVTIPEGATTATFPVTTVPVKKSESAMIQAYAAGVKVSANITVTATSVVSVTLNPATVVGGLNSTGTITLNGNAPTGGTTVQLYSTNAAAGVPSSVVVPGGSKTVTFPITTVPVATNTATTIAAKYLGTIKSAALTVAAPTVNTLTLSPSSLTGGATSKLTIKLTGKAATGGVVVTLTSSNTVVAQLPASVTIPAGSDTVDVTITTAAVAATTNVTVTAKTGTVSKTAVLTVNK